MANVQPANLDTLAEKLQNGIADFCFIKKDGSIRRAKGTLKAEYFSVMPKGVRPPNPAVYTYYDIEKDSFRCFKPENFLGYYKEA